MENQLAHDLQTFLSEASFILKEEIFTSDQTCVVSVIHSVTGETSVLKIRSRPNVNLEMESKWLDVLIHPNIVKKRRFTHFGSISILELEKVEGIALIDQITEIGCFDERSVRPLFEQLVSILRFLQEKKVVYLDLKPDNLIYNPKTQRLTLIDMEFVFPSSQRNFFNIHVGTTEYNAPEVQRGGSFGAPEAQNWSLGVTLFVLLFGKFPTFDLKSHSHSGSSRSNRSLPSDLSPSFRDPHRAFKVICPAEISTSCLELLEGLLEIEPSRRSSLTKIATQMKSRWISPKDPVKIELQSQFPKQFLVCSY